jgi:hypothetical protein
VRRDVISAREANNASTAVMEVETRRSAANNGAEQESSDDVGLKRGEIRRAARFSRGASSTAKTERARRASENQAVQARAIGEVCDARVSGGRSSPMRARDFRRMARRAGPVVGAEEGVEDAARPRQKGRGRTKVTPKPTWSALMRATAMRQARCERSAEREGANQDGHLHCQGRA